MSVYFDASVLVALFRNDPFTARARSFLQATQPELLVSDFAAAEFASALGRLTRTRELTPTEAQQACVSLDAWRAAAATQIEVTSADIRAADALLRRFDLALRTADAVHLAAAQRAGAELVTFDRQLASSARTIGAAVAAI